MKTSHFVSLILTLINVLEASKSGGKSNSKGTSPSSAPRAVNHVLLEGFIIKPASGETEAERVVEKTVLEGGIKILSSNKPFDKDDDDLVSLDNSDLGLTAAPSKKSANKRKRTAMGGKKGSTSSKKMIAKATQERDYESSEGEDEDAAVNALLSLRSSNASIEDGEEEAKPKAAKKKTFKTPKARELRPLTDKVFWNGKITSFDLYFDESNFATEGTDFLVRCFSNSHFYQLAHFLIMNGARLPITEEVLSALVVAKNDDTSSVAHDILMTLINVDPVEAAKLFARAAQEDETFDAFFLGLLLNGDSAGAYFKTSERLFEVFEIFAQSGRMHESLNFMMEERAAEFTIKAIKNGKLNLVELILERGWMKAEDEVLINGNSFTIICQLFGKFPHNRIMALIEKHNYNLAFSHDESVNPEGDALIVALAAKDLKLFKRLMMLGASLNVNLQLKGESVSLREYAKARRPDILAIIEAFDNGTLAAQIEAEDASENTAEQAVMQNIVAVATTGAAADLYANIQAVDLTMDEDN